MRTTTSCLCRITPRMSITLPLTVCRHRCRIHPSTRRRYCRIRQSRRRPATNRCSGHNEDADKDNAYAETCRQRLKGHLTADSAAETDSEAATQAEVVSLLLLDLCVGSSWHAALSRLKSFGGLLGGRPSVPRDSPFETPASAATTAQDAKEALAGLALAGLAQAAEDCHGESRVGRRQGGRGGNAGERQDDGASRGLGGGPDPSSRLSPPPPALATAAAWSAANHRAGFDKDKEMDVVKAVRSHEKLYRERRPKWCGVNLGGWLLLERGPSTPVYEVHDLQGDRGEYHTTLELRERDRSGGAGMAALVLHRRKHVTEEDVREIKVSGGGVTGRGGRVDVGWWSYGEGRSG